MKHLKRCAAALRILGWVLILIAAAVTIYALANGTKPWNVLKDNLKTVDRSAPVYERVAFDNRYFSALSKSASTKGQGEEMRIRTVRPYFSIWEDRLSDGLSELIDKHIEVFYSSLETDFDPEGYLEFYEALESGEESRLIKDAVEYLDSVAKPAAGKGGKVAKLQAASVEGDIKAIYEKLTAEKGEEAGEYLEYLETLVKLIKEDIAAGTKVADVKGYAASLDYDRYVSALAEVREQERVQSEDLRDSFAEAVKAYIGGDKNALKDHFEAQYTAISDKYAGEVKADKDVFLSTLLTLLGDKDFDGSTNTLMKQMRTLQNKEDETRVEAFMYDYSKSVVNVSDSNNSVGFMLVLWFFAAHCILWWLLGIALVIAARFLDRYVTRETVRRLDKAGIEEDNDVLLRVNHLKQYFRSGDYINKAVDDVSFYIKKGEVFGLVGESGCGKTTTGRTIINLYDPTEGDVYFEGLRISSTQNGLPVLIRSFKNEFNAELQQKQALLSEQIAADPSAKDRLQAEFKAWKAKRKEELDEKIAVARTRALESSAEKSKCVEKYREKRKAELTAAFNEDMKQLSGKAAEERKARYEIDMKVAAKDNIMTKMQMIFQDPVGSINPRMTVREIIAEGLKVRGIKDEKYIDEKVYEVLDLVGLVREHAARYPHEFSGGQKQRVGIARAIVLEPELIIADEPISALDVSIQAQIINLLNDLRERMGLTILFIAHNLSVVKYFSDRIGVMYYGHLVELTTSDELFAHPLHPYTKSLLSAIPYPDPYHEKYRKRIVYEPHKVHDYSVDKPTLREIRPGHFIRCNDKEFEEYKRELGI
jgi:ATPase components of various ABC-type transport systems, contain duplicated ATPase